jgi:hypothetical protein
VLPLLVDKKKKKKNMSFFLKGLYQILCPKNKKNSSENFLFKKKVLPFLVAKRKRKRRLYLKSFDF